MRLLTHNSLRCPAKVVLKGYPLLLEISEMEVIETECNLDFIKGLLPGLHWPGVVLVAEAVGLQDFPSAFTSTLLNDDTFLTAMHNLLMDIHIKEGVMKCPETGAKFPIAKGIPNMSMKESDV